MQYLTPQQLMVSLVILSFLAIIPGRIAKNKGRNFWIWYAYGIGFFILALFHSMILLPKESKPDFSAAKSLEQDVQPRVIKLAAQKYNYVYLDCPLELQGYIITHDFNTSLFQCLLLINDLSKKPIKSFTVKATCLDIDGEPIPGENILEKEFTFNDQEYTLDITPIKGTMKIQAIVTAVVFEDQDVWTYDASEKLEYEMKYLSATEQAEFKNLVGGDPVAFPKQEEDYWICSCGRANHTDEKECVNCKMEKEYLFKTLTPTTISNLRNTAIKKQNLIAFERDNKTQAKKDEEEKYAKYAGFSKGAIKDFDPNNLTPEQKARAKKNLAIIGVMILVNVVLFILLFS